MVVILVMLKKGFKEETSHYGNFASSAEFALLPLALKARNKSLALWCRQKMVGIVLFDRLAASRDNSRLPLYV